MGSRIARDALEGALHIWWHLCHPRQAWWAAAARSERLRAEAEEMQRIRWAKAVQDARNF